jgi:hypothetical protein
MISFYQRFGQTKLIHEELILLDLAEEERQQLLRLLENTFNHKILSAVMEELTDEDKVVFLEKVTQEDEVAVVEFIRLKTNDIENKIELVVRELTQQVVDDIREVR